MDNWNRIVDSYVVKVFRDIALEWWGLDVHFYDKSGNYKSNDVTFRNHICALMQTKKKTAKDCLAFRIENLKALNSSYNSFDCLCCENLRVIVVPIIVKGDHVGSMVCSGLQFPVSQGLREQIIRKLTRLGFDKTEVVQWEKHTNAKDFF